MHLWHNNVVAEAFKVATNGVLIVSFEHLKCNLANKRRFHGTNLIFYVVELGIKLSLDLLHCNQMLHK